MKKNLNRIASIFFKDLKSEYRNRYGISAITLFILTSITMLVFSTAQEKLTPTLFSGLLWVIMFFSAMTGLSKGFVREEEKQTSMLLKITSRPTAVYFGKLIYNLIFAIVMNFFAWLMFMVFFDGLIIKNIGGFLIILLLASIGLASATTVISAIISKAGMKNSLFTVLSFPVLIPLIIVGIEATTKTFEGAGLNELLSDLQILIAYSGILIPISYIVFDMIWEE
jgi:heme exporter protein B